MGAWQPVTAPAVHVAGTAAALDLWSARPRSSIYGFELLSGLTFDTSAESVGLEYRDRSETAAKVIAHIIRPSPADFTKQLEYVRNYAVLRMERSAEIASQINNIITFIGKPCGLRGYRHPRTIELLNALIGATTVIEMRIKHALACRRPDEYSPQIQPMLRTPGHGSFPSGHATESFVVAIVLDRLIKSANSAAPASVTTVASDPTFVQMMRIAERIAINRTVAGLHFPVDSAVGLVLARVLADFYLRRLSGSGGIFSRTFDGTGFDRDFIYEDVWTASDVACGPPSTGSPAATAKICRADVAVPIPQSDLLQHLWRQAISEWQAV